MDSLYELTYNQESLGAILKKLNISEERLEIIPWSLGDAVVNDTGEILGYISENEFGEVDIMDPFTNVVGRITSTNEHNYQLWGEFMEYIGDVGLPLEGSTEITNLINQETTYLPDDLLNTEIELPDIQSLDELTSILDFI